jgi:hypothetical protein
LTAAYCRINGVDGSVIWRASADYNKGPRLSSA